MTIFSKHARVIPKDGASLLNFPEGFDRTTDNGHPERAFFQKFKTFGLGQTNWAEILWGIWGISGQTISIIQALWVPCPWESVAGSLSYKKLWFLGLKHTTPKCSQNKILAVNNLEKSLPVVYRKLKYSAETEYFYYLAFGFGRQNFILDIRPSVLS